MLTNLEKRVIAVVQGDLPIRRHPYREIAQRLNISEDQLMATLRDLRDRGILRRFGATLRHRISGFTSNAMIAWRVDEERADDVGRIMAEFREVSHCYQRVTAPEWPYNLYTMIHARDEESCRRIAAQMADKTGVQTYTLLFSRREFKKTSMRYFDEWDPYAPPDADDR